MIANKILPSLYIIDLEGEAANLDFLLGKKFGVQRLIIGSLDFENDLAATEAGKHALEYFIDNPRLDMEDAKEQVDFNPEFFPSLPPLNLTDEQKMLEQITVDAANKQAKDGQIPLVLTRHFDVLGDYVQTRLSVEGGNFKASLKIAVNPEAYLTEKGITLEEQMSVGLGAHREIQPTTTIH